MSLPPALTTVVLFFLIGLALFLYYYNSPVFAENICSDVKLSFGNECRVVMGLESKSYAEVLVDGNWVHICDSNIGNYCNAVN